VAKILFITPHLSTGGQPQYLLQQVQLLLPHHDVHVAEWQDVTGGKFIVQRSQIAALLGAKFYSLDSDELRLLNLVKQIDPDIVHFQEIPETFLPESAVQKIHNLNASYLVYETSHSSSTDFVRSVRWLPDKFVLVSPYQITLYESLGVPCELVEYVIPAKPRVDRNTTLLKLGLDPNKRHVLNVGLFTPGKNQAEIIDLARRMLDYPIQFHFVGNTADNFADYWKPLLADLPANCRVWGEQADVDKYYSAMDLFLFTSTYECNPLVVKEAMSWRLPVLMRNLPTYVGMTFDTSVSFLTDSVEQNVELVLQKVGLEPAPIVSAGIHIYANTTRYRKHLEDTFEVSYLNGPKLSIDGHSKIEYDVFFTDLDTNNLVYRTKLTPGCWAKPSNAYYTRWEICVRNAQTGIETFRHVLNLNDKRVLIGIESRALGDTLAWFPYIEEFRKQRGCTVIVSTFWNELFRAQYPQIEFVSPGDEVPNVQAQYLLGWFFTEKGELDSSHHKRDVRKMCLQQTAADILGIEFREIRPLLGISKSSYESKRVGIGTQATMQLKYWNNLSGWPEVVKWLRDAGYTVTQFSREESPFMGNHTPKGAEPLESYNIEHVLRELATCDFFIGLSSGLSWLAWAMGIPTFVVEGAVSLATMPSEVVKVDSSLYVCRNCFSRYRFRTDKWDWCPDHQEDTRRFECTSSISASEVINAIKKELCL
jgi:autotransporter strand-loop-strand O-heptosyltransferase